LPNTWKARFLTVAIALICTAGAFAGVSRQVRFSPGSSGTVIDGSVIRGDRDRYYLGAGGGQVMSVSVRSPENNAVFDLYTPSGRALASESTRWSGRLPASGNYAIVVGGTRGNARYSLHVTIR
jgi:hypothetical protein